MKNKHLLLVMLLCIGFQGFAQNQKEKMTREEKNEKNQARQDRINNRNDIALFKKQMLGLKEYAKERKKITELQKTSKMVVKVTVVIDSDANDNAADSKTLIGYIKQDVGDNSTNMYEIIYDRAQKKIVDVKQTQEGIESERESAEEREEKPAKKPAVKNQETRKPVVKKKKDPDDDEDDPDEEKPAKGKKDADDD